MGPYGLVALRLSLPFLALLELALTYKLTRPLLSGRCCGFGLSRCCKRGGRGSSDGSRSGGLSPRTLALLHPSAFSRTAVSLVIDSFTTVTSVVLDTLVCVRAGDERVVFALPSSKRQRAACCDPVRLVKIFHYVADCCVFSL
jgi:hypothetical protein